MRANFFVMFPTADDGRRAGHLHRRLPRAATAPGFDNALGRDFPNITNVDISASIAQVQRVLDQVVRAVEFLFGFTLAAGLVVLFAAVTRHARGARARVRGDARARRERPLLAQVQRAELLGVGALAGVLASLAAIAVGWALARYAFEFSWNAVAAGCRWPAARPARCWRWRPAGGACARCCAAGGGDAAPGRRRLRRSSRVRRARAAGARSLAAEGRIAGRILAAIAAMPAAGTASARPAPRGFASSTTSCCWPIWRAAACRRRPRRVESEGEFLEALERALGRRHLRLQPAGLLGPGRARAAEGARPRRALHPGLGRDRRGHRGRGDAQRRQRLPAEEPPRAPGAGAAACGRRGRDAARAERGRPRAASNRRSACSELAQHLQTSVEHERAAIAREIHDDVGGSLTALKFDLAWIARHSSTPQVIVARAARRSRR